MYITCNSFVGKISDMIEPKERLGGTEPIKSEERFSVAFIGWHDSTCQAFNQINNLYSRLLSLSLEQSNVRNIRKVLHLMCFLHSTER